jgi:hypothetical protein
MYQWRRGSTIMAVDVSDSTNSILTYGPVTTADTSASWRIALTNAASPVITTVTKTFSVTVQADFDRDLLPDPWEVANGFSTNDPGNASADLDGDSMTLLEEYTVGTDWTDPASYLRIDNISVPGAALIEFQAVSNRTYSVQYQDDGLTSEWSKLFDVFAVNTNRTIQVMDPAPTNAPQRVYRLVVPAQP